MPSDDLIYPSQMYFNQYLQSVIHSQKEVTAILIKFTEFLVATSKIIFKWMFDARNKLIKEWSK